MPSLLRIDASPRGARSLSRGLADTFCNHLLTEHSGLEIIARDLRQAPPPFVSEAWVAAAFKPAEENTEGDREALRYSDAAIAELEEAQVVVISTPLYNYGMPSILKAWVDQVVRVRKTFTFDLARGDFPIEPVLSGKHLVVLASAGEFGFEQGGLRGQHDHLRPHLATVARYLGADEVSSILIEYQEFGDARHAASKDQAHRDAAALAGRIAETLAV